MSSRDHPDWWKNVGGSNSQDSTLERRSLVWNDDNILDGAVPAVFHTGLEWKAKFFSRGMRGKIERVWVYCIRTAAGVMSIGFSPQPRLRSLFNVTVTPGAGWAWVSVAVREMWNYDSLFLIVRTADIDVSYAYDLNEPYDYHRSNNLGVSWLPVDGRLFIRVEYTAETPGDVPVSGVVNVISIPNEASRGATATNAVPLNVETELIEWLRPGSCSFIEFRVHAAASSEQTALRVYCDEALIWEHDPLWLDSNGFTTATPTVSLPTYLVDGVCVILIHHRFEFKRQLRITCINTVAAQTVDAWAYPTLLR